MFTICIKLEWNKDISTIWIILNTNKIYRQPIRLDKDNNEYFLVKNKECNLFNCSN